MRGLVDNEQELIVRVEVSESVAVVWCYLFAYVPLITGASGRFDSCCQSAVYVFWILVGVLSF